MAAKTVRDVTDEEVLLQVAPVSMLESSLTPHLRCSNCGYRNEYFFWYRYTGFKDRLINHCPGCGFPIAGTIISEEGTR